MSLDDKQNIVTQRLNQLNDALDRARAAKKASERGALQPGQALIGDGTVAGCDSGDRDQNAQVQTLKNQARRAAAADARSCSERYGEKHPQAMQAVNAQLAGRADGSSTSRPRGRCSRSSNEYETAVLEEQTLRAEPRRRRKADAQDLSRKSVGYNVMEREAKSNRAGLRVAAAAREGAARLEQQPREQRARRRPRRSAEGADHAGRPPHVADVGRRSASCWRSASRSASTT